MQRPAYIQPHRLGERDGGRGRMEGEMKRRWTEGEGVEEVSGERKGGRMGGVKRFGWHLWYFHRGANDKCFDFSAAQLAGNMRAETPG